MTAHVQAGLLFDWKDAAGAGVATTNALLGTSPRARGNQDYLKMDVFDEVADHFRRACGKHGPMRGPHEGYAVLLEKVEELWAEVKAKTFNPSSARKEALQVAAMAVRFIVDVLDGGRRQEAGTDDPQ